MIGSGKADRTTRLVALAFLAIGAGSVVLVRHPLLAEEIVLATAIVLWGLSGIALSLTMRPAPEWGLAAAGFALLVLIGLGLAASPGRATEALALLAIFGLLCEGVFSILYAARLHAESPGSLWLFLSGVAALVIGFAVLWGWPAIEGSLLGLLLGLNFLTTGLSLLLVARRMRRPVR